MLNKIEKALIELGITPELKGFDYICRSVEIITDSKDKKRTTADIYSQVAKDFGTTVPRVEKGIRHAITRIDTKSEAFSEYINTDRMTNSTVLYLLARRLMEE